jgi:superfamily I DNA/RNA helicase
VERWGADSLLVASLTKAAAVEIGARSQLPEERVGTLHAFCFRGLGAPPIAECDKATLRAWNEEHPSWRLSTRVVDIDNPGPEFYSQMETYGDRLFQEAQILRHRLTSHRAWPEATRKFHEVWLGHLDETGAVDFTGLIERGLKDIPSAPHHPAMLVIDEGQDLSLLEMALVRSWSLSAERLVMAGDSNQAIYEWRGANHEAFLEDEIPEENERHLSQSYRLSQQVHQASWSWLQQARDPYLAPFEPTEEEGHAGYADFDARDPARAVWGAVRDARDGRSAMILASCGYMLDEAMRLLKAEGVPFFNPYKPKHGRWNPLRQGAMALHALLSADPRLMGSGEAVLWSPDALHSWVRRVDYKWLGRGVKKQVSDFRDASAVKDRGRPMEPAQLKSLIPQPVLRELHDALCKGTKHAVRWYRSKLLAREASALEFPMRIAQKQGVEALAQEPKVIVGTIHSAKGGEADSVYIMPNVSPRAMEAWDCGDRDPLVRTFYVGQTRARTKLVRGMSEDEYSLEL